MSHSAVIDGAQVTERAPSRERVEHEPIPFRTIVGVELRKAFDTRSGFWLLVAIAAAGVLTTGAVLAQLRNSTGKTATAFNTCRVLLQPAAPSSPAVPTPSS